MESQHTEVQGLIDEFTHAPEKLVLVGHEGQQHANGEGVLEHALGAEVDNQNGQDPYQQRVGGAKEELQLLRGELAVHGLHQQVEPMGAAAFLAIEELNGFDAAQRLQEVTVPSR